MILYHFTPVENVETIKRDGLQASAGIDDDMVGSGHVHRLFVRHADDRSH
jgi:hypothetical protein